MNIRHFSAQLDIVCTRLGVIHINSGVSRCCWRARSSWCSRKRTTLPLLYLHRRQTSSAVAAAAAKNRPYIQGSGEITGFQYQKLNRNCHSSSLYIDCACCTLNASKSVGGRQLFSSSVKYQWPCCSAACSHRQIVCMTQSGREEAGHTDSVVVRQQGERKRNQNEEKCSNESLPKVLVLTGATAVGKTQLSLQLAKKLDAEIISADSVQVYKGLDIGSDKIMESERQGIPHHLIDIMDPKDDFSAGDFYYAARDAIEDVLKRGKTPMVVGGTGFYLKWLVCGKPSTPIATKESEENVRLALEQAFEKAAKEKKGIQIEEDQHEKELLLTMEEKWKAGVELVRQLGDTEAANRLEHQETNNWYRMNRVLDILMQRPGKTLAELDADAAIPPDYDFRCIFLHRPRITLYRRIDERVEHMLCQGLLTETAEKLTSKGLEPDTNCATRAIGYRQAMKYLQRLHSLEDPSEAITEKEIIQLAKDIQNASRQLCHRQMNWFRKDSKFKWIQADQDHEQVVEEIMTLYCNEEANEPEEGGLKRVRLTKEEEKELKTYITEFKVLTPGSQELLQVVQESRDIVNDSK